MQKGFCALKTPRVINGGKYIVVSVRDGYGDNGLQIEYKIASNGLAFRWNDSINYIFYKPGVGRTWREIKPDEDDDESYACYYDLGCLVDGVYCACYSNPEKWFGQNLDGDSVGEYVYMAVVKGAVEAIFTQVNEAIYWLRKNATYIELRIEYCFYNNIDFNQTIKKISMMGDYSVPGTFIYFVVEGLGKLDNNLYLKPSYLLANHNRSIDIATWLSNQTIQIGRDSDYITYDITVKIDQLGYVHFVQIGVSVATKEQLSMFGV